MTTPNPTPYLPTLPDGSPDFGALEPTLIGMKGSNTSTSASGQTREFTPGQPGYINIWNLPTAVLNYESNPGSTQPFYWQDVTTKTTAYGKYEPNPETLKFMEANGLAYPHPPELPYSAGSTPETTTTQPSLQYISGDDVMAQYASMALHKPAAYAALQKQLYQAGFYGNISTQPPTVWGDETATALGKAMVAYIQVSRGAGEDITFPDFLTSSVTNNLSTGGLGSDGQPGNTPAPPTLEDPATLALYAQKAAQAALGRNLSPEQVNQFVAQYHNEQQQAAAGKSAGNTVNTSDPRAEAINFVTSNNQGAFAHNQIQGFTDAFLNMFMSGQSAAPNVNTDPTAVSF